MSCYFEVNVDNKTRFDNAAKVQFAEVFSEDISSLLPEGFDPSKVVAEKSKRKASVSITMIPSMKRNLLSKTVSVRYQHTLLSYWMALLKQAICTNKTT